MSLRLGGPAEKPGEEKDLASLLSILGAMEAFFEGFDRAINVRFFRR